MKPTRELPSKVIVARLPLSTDDPSIRFERHRVSAVAVSVSPLLIDLRVSEIRLEISRVVPGSYGSCSCSCTWVHTWTAKHASESSISLRFSASAVFAAHRIRMAVDRSRSFSLSLGHDSLGFQTGRALDPRLLWSLPPHGCNVADCQNRCTPDDDACISYCCLETEVHATAADELQPTPLASMAKQRHNGRRFQKRLRVIQLVVTRNVNPVHRRSSARGV